MKGTGNYIFPPLNRKKRKGKLRLKERDGVSKNAQERNSRATARKGRERESFPNKGGKKKGKKKKRSNLVNPMQEGEEGRTGLQRKKKKQVREGRKRPSSGKTGKEEELFRLVTRAGKYLLRGKKK